ncbi:hypothetical protein [Ureibacillus endophyticus]|uniref:Uncharacterized protein n=1 Tax=Ureibacillus endophyticus TaxID=1978490 RepID=A0A494Z4P3_9BACL|nr:hypothetical protein [Lysinibacillus endophyticus]RKQ16955.1 hypothetical protein D8M03_08745 [Lysinibacillus endophyticus]
MKLNMLSALYAIMIFVPLELMLNVYRIARITHLEVGTINVLTGIIIIADIIGGSILLFYLTNEWQTNYWTALLWFPYFVLFIYFFAKLFPITDGGDSPNPVTGLLGLGGVIVYPFYILVLTGFARGNRD